MKKVTVLVIALLFVTGMAFSAAAQQQQQRDTTQQQGTWQQQEQAQQQQRQQRDQQQAGDQINMRNRLAKFEDLTGVTVTNQRGEELGTVSDAVIDAQSGKVEYLVLNVGGTAGLGGKSIAVPMSQFQLSNRRLVLNITRDRLENAPDFGEAQWPPANEQKWAQNVKSYFSKQGKQQQAAGQAGQRSQSQASPMSR